jgi:hypothetical protein
MGGFAACLKKSMGGWSGIRTPFEVGVTVNRSGSPTCGITTKLLGEVGLPSS